MKDIGDDVLFLALLCLCLIGFMFLVDLVEELIP